MFRNKIIVAGSGGQGALRVGQMIAYAALNEDLEATWLPSYGAEMRGGTANCCVVISSEPIICPIVLEPTELIAMNLPSLLKFEPTVVPNGTVFVNSSIIQEKVQRTDLRAIYVPCLEIALNSSMIDLEPTCQCGQLKKVPFNEIAQELGNLKVANMVMLGAYIEAMGNLGTETIKEMLVHMFTGPKAKLVDLNIEALRRGAACVR